MFSKKEKKDELKDYYLKNKILYYNKNTKKKLYINNIWRWTWLEWLVSNRYFKYCTHQVLITKNIYDADNLLKLNLYLKELIKQVNNKKELDKRKLTHMENN